MKNIYLPMNPQIGLGTYAVTVKQQQMWAAMFPSVDVPAFLDGLATRLESTPVADRPKTATKYAKLILAELEKA